jgi:excinuclease ABC subunit A
VVVIEHNLDVIKTADWVIDLGPKAAIAAAHPRDRHAGGDREAAAFAYRPLPRPLLGITPGESTRKAKPQKKKSAA